MAVWNHVRLSSLSFGQRLDPEFYQPDLLSIRANLSQYPLLKECLADIRYGVQAEPEYVEKGIPYVRAMNLNNPWIGGEILQIDSKQVPNEDYLLSSGDILITRSGANCGAVGIVTDLFAKATYGSYTIRLRANDNVNPFVLFAFLLTKYGLALTSQIRYGSAQPNLSIPYLKNLIHIPEVTNAVAVRVETLVRDAVALAHSERQQYDEVTDNLLDQLGWQRLERLPRELSYATNLSKLSAFGRTDAEFFHPHAVRIHSMLSNQNQTLADVTSLREELFTPQRGQTFHYIEIGDIATNTTLGGTKLLGENAPSRAQQYVRAKDVITSTVRPLRQLSGLVAPEQDGWVCSSGFAVLKPRNVPPEYLVAYLRLQPVCELMNAYAMASMYPAITVADLLKVPFFMPERNLVNRICKAVTVSRDARKQAESKLAQAKKLVEEAINS